MSKKKTVAKRSSAQAMLSAFGRRRTWREWAKPSDAGNQVAKKPKAKKIKTKRKRTAKTTKSKKRSSQPGVRVVAMSKKEQAEKTHDQILRLFFQGVVGRQPETDQELKKWLASPVGRVAVMFDATSLSRWGETGRS
jgi:predicted RNA polymerase sigma factor